MDWFVSAIVCEGSVDDSLTTVMSELENKISFIKILKEKLTPRQSGTLDAISDLSQRVKILDATLNFRLGLLSPDRPGAWFRPAIVSKLGPFSSKGFEEPVFRQYTVPSIPQIRKAIQDCWKKKKATHDLLCQRESTLWIRLLSLNEEWEELARFPEPFASYRFDTLPNGLSKNLESRALTAFLANTKKEMLHNRTKLDDCFISLFSASEKLWTYQESAYKEYKTEKPKQKNQGFSSSGTNADFMREEFRKRRQEKFSKRPNILDFDALRFLGFDEIPDLETLRRRYLTMAKELHPDRPGGNEDAFKLLNKAYNHLLAKRFSKEHRTTKISV